MKKTLNSYLKLVKRKLNNRLIKGVCTILSCLFFSFCIPPFQIYAESVGGSSPIIGVNITYIGYDGEVVPHQTTVHFDTEQTMWRCTSSHSTMGCQVWESENINGSTLDEITGTITTNATSTYTYRLYQYEFIFDKTYVGSITFNGNHPGATTTTKYYINGNRLVLTDINLVTSFTIGSYSLTYAPLEVINQMRQWNFPIESFGAIYPLMRSGINQVGIANLNEYTYPIFEVNQGDILFNSANSTYERHNRYLIFGIDRNLWGTSLLSTYFNWDSSLINFEVVSIVNSFRSYPDNNFYYIIKCSINGLSDTSYTITANRTFNIMPIYFNYQNYSSLSTDFALRFGLSNQLLDDLHIVAQGTSNSDSAASGLDSETNTFESVASGLYTSENSFNQNMNSSLQSIDTSFNPSTSFGSKFLYSADWVRSQFNNLTSQTPFGSVLSFSMLLGLSLLIIGKVFK